MFASISIVSRVMGEPDCLDWIAMAQELGVPHTLDSAVAVIMAALASSPKVTKLTHLGTGQDGEKPFVMLAVEAHLSDGQEFTVQLAVS